MNYFYITYQKFLLNGREVLASALILNVPSRADWKNCSATRQEEEQDTQEMRKQFEPFDFTDDD